jgi:hypothetical protein
MNASPSSLLPSLVKAVMTTFARIGKTLLVPWVPRLRELSGDEVSEHKRYRNILALLGVAVTYMVFGALVVLWGLIEGRLGSASLLSLVLVGVGLLGGAIFIGILARQAIEVSDRSIDSGQYRDLALALRKRRAEEEELFQNNLRDAFTVQTFAYSGISFFKDGEYRFARRVNVLLGRNGYGKTLLFRSLVALLQRDKIQWPSIRERRLVEDRGSVVSAIGCHGNAQQRQGRGDRPRRHILHRSRGQNPDPRDSRLPICQSEPNRGGPGRREAGTPLPIGRHTVPYSGAVR